MSATESSFDEIRVEFEDDFTESDDENTRSGFRDHGRGGDTKGIESVVDSVTSSSIVNTLCTTRLDCGPNACPTGITSKWVLGVRHPSFASKLLNQRMAERGKHFKSSDSSLYSNSRDLRPKSSVQKNTKASMKTMDAIREDPIEPYDTYRSHQTNGNVIYNKNGFTLLKEKVEFTRFSDRQINIEVNSSKSQKSENKSVLQLNDHKAKDPINSDLRAEPMVNSKPIPKIDYNIEDNDLNRNDSDKRTKNFDKKLKVCDQKQKRSENHLNSIHCEKKSNNKNLRTNSKTVGTQLENTNFKRTVNSVTLSSEQELKRYKSQRFCETISLITIILGLVLVTITPFLLIPIWVIPNPYSPLIRNFLWLSMLMTILLMTLAALTGNIYWYFDQKRHKWSWFYHCGKGPQNHYWGSTLSQRNLQMKPLAKNRTNHISLNV